MSKRPVPAGIVLFCLVLAGIAAGGFLSSSMHIGYWRRGFYDEGLFRGIFIAGVFLIVPCVALIDIYRRRLSGLYLGLVPLLLMFGFALRVVTAAFANERDPSADRGGLGCGRGRGRR